MIEIDITMVIQIINILVLIGVLNVVLYKPVRTMLAKREERVTTLDKEIDTFHENAKLRQEEIDRKMQDARIRAKEELETARSSATASGAEVVEKIRAEANETKNAHLNEIAKQFASAREELQGQVDGFSSEIAGKIMGRAV